MAELEVNETGGDITFKVTVKPKARQNAVEGIRSGTLIVHVTAAPDRGEANRAVIETVAKWLGIAKSQIEITAGHKSRQKNLRASGLKKADLIALLVSSSSDAPIKR